MDEPDPKFGNLLLEQFGDANGELVLKPLKTSRDAAEAREITHRKAFTLALESLGQQPFSIGENPAEP